MDALVQHLNRGLRKIPIWPLYGLAFVPLGFWIYAALTNTLGPDPVKTLEHGLGKIALQFLVGPWLFRLQPQTDHRFYAVLGAFLVASGVSLGCVLGHRESPSRRRLPPEVAGSPFACRALPREVGRVPERSEGG